VTENTARDSSKGRVKKRGPAVVVKVGQKVPRPEILRAGGTSVKTGQRAGHYKNG